MKDVTCLTCTASGMKTLNLLFQFSLGLSGKHDSAVRHVTEGALLSRRI
jgi:hypothetical protein